MRRYKSDKLRRKDGTGSFLKVPHGWTQEGDRFYLDYKGDTITATRGGFTLCSRSGSKKYGYYGFTSEWDAGTIYLVKQYDDKIIFVKQ